MRKNHISGKMKRILAVACAAMLAVSSVPANTVAYASEAETTQEAEVQNDNKGAGENNDVDNTNESNDVTNDNSENGKSGEETSESGKSGEETSESGKSGEETSESGKSGETSESGKSGETSESGKSGETSESGKSGEKSETGKSETDKTSDKGGNTKADGENETKGQESKEEKEVVIDFGIDENASEMRGNEYVKLVFKASAKDSSSLETEIKKVEYALIDTDGDTVKSGEIGEESVLIKAEDLQKKYDSFKLKVTATDVDDEKTSDEKDIKFIYAKPEVTINIDSEESQTISEGTAYTKLVFGAEATIDAETELKHFKYELVKGDIKVEGIFEKGNKVTIDGEVLKSKVESPTDPSGEYTLTVTAVDKNDQEGSKVLDKVY